MSRFINGKRSYPSETPPDACPAVPRVLVIDPSLFTQPYDEALVGALAAAGADATLVGRPARPGETPPVVPFRPAFYRHFDAGPRRGGRFGAGLKAAEHVADALRLTRQSPDVFHHQWLPFPLADRRALRLARRRAAVVLTVHDTEPFNGTPTAALQSRGFLPALAETDRLIVHTAAGRARLAAAGLDPARIHIIPHGPLSPRPLPPEPPGAAGPRFTLVAFGRMRPYKGLDVLIEAFASLDLAARDRLRLVIAGEPLMDLAPLRAAIDAAGLQPVVELRPERLDDPAMAALFARADGFVFPYREIEASGVFYLVQGLRRWIVASRLGAFAEALEDGVSARLVAPGDAASLAAALRECGEARPRPLAGPRVTGWETIAHATLEVYAAALADRGRR